MPNTRVKAALLCVSCMLMWASEAQGAGFKLLRDAWGSSGGFALAGGTRVGSTLGQCPSGASAAGSFVESAGFWHGIRPPVLDVPVSEELTPLRFGLENAMPNPFTGRTTLHYSIPGGAVSPVQLRIYDVAGRLVRVLEPGAMKPGLHTVVWDGRGGAGEVLHAGVYFCLMEAARFRASRRIVHLP